VAVNSQLIMLYWDMGRQIVEKQETAKWGSGFIGQLSKDLKMEFPDTGGFSVSNIYEIVKFYKYFSRDIEIFKQAVGKIENEKPKKETNLKFQQAVGKIAHTKIQQVAGEMKYDATLQLCLQVPWGHIVLILQKADSPEEVKYYLQQTIENNWSRAVLQMQIESNLYSRQGKAINNFKNTLPEIDSDLTNALLKDPYNFDFLNLTTQVKEQELEQKLIENITRFLLELGKGFAYMGRQFKIIVGGKEYKTDLLFYHTRLKRYIIIELKGN
jgi:predicted nuclease of restriction endonuclease-like (RecB) superfamily